MVIFFRFFIFAVASVLFYVYCSLSIEIKCASANYTFSKNDVFFTLIICYTMLELILYLYRYINTFKEKLKILRIGTSIENAIISIFTKNEKLAEKNIKILKKIFKFSDNTSLIVWLEGCNKLAQNKNHEAKALFYSGTYSDSPVLSGYSLYKLCDSEKNTSESYNTLTYLKDKCGIGNLPKESVHDLIKYQLLNKDFEQAREIIKYLNNNRLLGISYFLENNDSIDCLKYAYKYAKEIPTIALLYANKVYFLNSSQRIKRKILLKSWKLNFLPEIFDAIIDTVEKDNQINFAKSIIQESSFEGLFKLGELLYNNEIYAMSLNYFKKAFSVYPSEECALRIITIENLLNKHSFDTSSFNLAKHPYWSCSECGNSSNTWYAFCPVCNALDSIQWTKSYQQKKVHSTQNELLSIGKY